MMSETGVVSGDFLARTTRRAQSRSETTPATASFSITTRKPTFLSAISCSAVKTLSLGRTVNKARGFELRILRNERYARISSGRLMGLSIAAPTLTPLGREGRTGKRVQPRAERHAIIKISGSDRLT